MPPSRRDSAAIPADLAASKERTVAERRGSQVVGPAVTSMAAKCLCPANASAARPSRKASQGQCHHGRQARSNGNARKRVHNSLRQAWRDREALLTRVPPDSNFAPASRFFPPCADNLRGRVPSPTAAAPLAPSVPSTRSERLHERTPVLPIHWPSTASLPTAGLTPTTELRVRSPSLPGPPSPPTRRGVGGLRLRHPRPHLRRTCLTRTLTPLHRLLTSGGAGQAGTPG
jgi:hypothetical protein